MLKSSSLCLYSSNLDTFWLKIEQFWPFEEISIISNGGHLGYRMASETTGSNGTKLGRKHLYKVLYKVSSFRPIPPTNMATKGNTCF
jgi:hypothetical protein